MSSIPTVFDRVFSVIRGVVKLERYKNTPYSNLLEESLIASCYVWTLIRLGHEDKEVAFKLFNLLGKTGQDYFDDLKKIESERN